MTKSKSTEGKGIKIAKLHLGQQQWEYGSPIKEWSIEDKLREWEGHHSCIDEKVLVEMLEKIEDKINKIIKKVNNKL